LAGPLVIPPAGAFTSAALFEILLRKCLKIRSVYKESRE